MAEQAQVFNTPDGIEYFRLAPPKSQVRLESLGMKSSGGALRPRIAAEFGLKPRVPHAAYIQAIEARMKVLLDKRAVGG